MAKAPTETPAADQTNTSDASTGTARVAVTATGVALLQLIKDAPGGYLMLTQEEGSAIVAAGQAAIDPSITADTVNGTVAVRLTQLGNAALAAAPTAAKTGRSSTTVSAILKGGPPPPAAGKRGGFTRGSKYPFDELEIGDSFHLKASLEDANPLTAVQSSLAAAREKYSVPAVDGSGAAIMETVKVRTYKKDADGKLSKDADGHRILEEAKDVTQQKRNPTRAFVAAAVGADDPEGVGARVWRVELPAS